MRVIKFRAWIEPPHGNMIYSLDLLHNGRIEYSYGSRTFNPKIDKNVKVMQFTGLKDKNGKEIYEGDIVKIGNNEFEEDMDENILYIIEYCQGAFSFRGDGLIFSGLNLEIKGNDYLKVEVIGNIYENPELLKDKNKEVEK